MNPFYQDDWATLYNADGRYTDIASESVGLLVTDPPYNKGKDYGPWWDDKMKPEVYRQFVYEWLSEAKRLLHGAGSMYFSCASTDLFFYRDMLTEVGLTFFHLLIWHRPNLFGRRIPGNRGWGFQYEPVFWCGKGKQPVLVNISANLSNSDVIRAASPQRNWRKELRRHITQKPELLYKTLIAKTLGEPIVDLFVGSGTSLVIAKQLRRKAIGFEINPEYCALAAQRIRETTVGMELMTEEQAML